MEIPIVFSSNDYFVPYMSAMIQSIMENASPNNDYHLFVLNQNITNNTKNKLKIQISYFPQFSIKFLNVKRIFEKHNFFISGHITIEAYYRLAIPYLFSNYEKVIYMDGDMICRFDVAELFHINIGENMLASSRDVLAIGNFYKYGTNFKDNDRSIFDGLSALKQPDNYFIDGMLVFNIKKWSISLDGLLNLATERKWKFHDQDFLNVFCEGRTLLLPIEYDFTDYTQNDPVQYCIDFLPDYIKAEYYNAKKNPKIIHFNTNHKKPWNTFVYIPYFDFFWKYATRTPFINIIIDRMNSANLIGRSTNLKNIIITNIKNKKIIGPKFLLKCFLLWISARFT
jgi:lipopolysaccharide biosynthesis glycosyltransferase